MNKKKLIILLLMTIIIVYVMHMFIPTYPAPGKAIIKHNFDTIIAYGENFYTKIDYDVITKSNLLSDKDNNEVEKFSKKEAFFNKDNTCKYELALGKADGVDTVELRLLHSKYLTYATLGRKYKTFTFESNLAYSYDDILLKFKEVYDIDITKEMLEDCSSDENHNYTGGISLYFREVEDVYEVYYVLNYNGNKYQIYM